MIKFHEMVSIVATAAISLAVATGCCRKQCVADAVSAEGLSVEQAIDLVIAAATNSVPATGSEEDEYVPAAKHPTEEDARTNLVARFALQARTVDEEIAKVSEKRTAALEAAKESNPEISAAYEAAVAARRRYDDLIASQESIKEIDSELARLRRVRGELLKQREKFASKSISTPASKKESK